MDTQIKKGLLDLCVLSFLMDKDMYGYEIVQSISKSIEVSEGTIYPILRRLSKEGFFEYLVQVTVNYTTTVPENPAGVIFDDIKSIEWRIVRLKNAGVIADKKNIVPVKYEAETDVRALKRFAGELGSDIETAIRRYDERGVTR